MATMAYAAGGALLGKSQLEKAEERRDTKTYLRQKKILQIRRKLNQPLKPASHSESLWDRSFKINYVYLLIKRWEDTYIHATEAIELVCSFQHVSPAD